MSYREISRTLGRYFLYLAAIVLIPLGVAITYEFFLEKTIYFSTPATFAFLETIAICLLCSQFFTFLSRKSTGTLYRRESILLVGLIWFFTTGIGALPFLFTQTIPSPVDAYFESMSGLSTTGATIIQSKVYDASGQEIAITAPNPLDPAMVYTFYGTVPPMRDPATHAVVKVGIEALGKPLLFWRSFLQWLGGMGIVALFIAVLPALSMGGKFLFETEIPGPTKEGMTPRIKETASLLWKIYLGLTVFQIVLLILTNPNMPFFDAVSLSLSTISTGGFTVRNDGLAGYNSFHTHWIITLFMIFGSINFTLYFHALRGKFYRLYEPELLSYILIVVFGCLLMTWNLWDTPKFFSNGVFSLKEAFVFGSLQSISTQTTTGYSLFNYDFWPFSCQLLMLILMYIGGMSGSTSGGIKVIRYVILLRIVKNKINTLFRPELVRSLKVGEKEISDKTAMTVLTFFCIVIALGLLGTYLLVLDNNDPMTAFGVVSSMISNSGLSIGGIGCNSSFAFLSSFSKIISILWMALGRLEYFSLLVLLVPAFWKKQ
jgi:trk system potassium uptake protein TrkH